MHRQGKNKEKHKLTYKQTGCKQKLFFFLKEYKTALPRCIIEKLYGVTAALEKATLMQT